MKRVSGLRYVLCSMCRMLLLALGVRAADGAVWVHHRASSARLLAAFCKGTALDFEDFKPDMVKGLVHLFGADEEPVLAAGPLPASLFLFSMPFLLRCR